MRIMASFPKAVESGSGHTLPSPGQFFLVKQGACVTELVNKPVIPYATIAPVALDRMSSMVVSSPRLVTRGLRNLTLIGR